MSEAALACVVDTSAVLALLWEEPGADMVAAALEQAAISAVNWSELVAVMTERGLPDDAVRGSLSALPIAAVVPFEATTRKSRGAFGDPHVTPACPWATAPALHSAWLWGCLS